MTENTYALYRHGHSGKKPLCDGTQLPPAFVIVDENDVLRDEGEAYARKLIVAGVPTTSVRYNGTLHDFMMLNRAEYGLPTVHYYWIGLRALLRCRPSGVQADARRSARRVPKSAYTKL